MIKGFYIGADGVNHKIAKILDPSTLENGTKLLNNFEETFTYKDRVLEPTIINERPTTVFKNVITRDRDGATYIIPDNHLSSWFWVLED